MLTPQKRKFADAILDGKSLTEAALAAGYSAASARQTGSRLVNKDPSVRAYIDDKKAKKPKIVINCHQGDEVEKSLEPAPDDVSSGVITCHDPKAILSSMMLDLSLDPKLRLDAAKALMPFVHRRMGEGGKKEERQEAAAKASKGRFGAGRPPLKVVGGK